MDNRTLFHFVVKKDSEIVPRRRRGREEVRMKDIILSKPSANSASLW